MSYSPRYDRGNWKCYCDACGRLVKASELRQRWDGFMVDDRCWEPRQPQDFVRGVADIQTPPFTRPEPSNTFLPIIYVYTPDGTAPISPVQSITSTSLVYIPVNTGKLNILVSVGSTLLKLLGKVFINVVTNTVTLTQTLSKITPTLFSDSENSTSTNQTTLTINKPAFASSKFLFVSLYNSDDVGIWSSSGWTFIYNTNGKALAYRQGSADSSYTFTCSVSSKLMGIITAVSNGAHGTLGNSITSTTSPITIPAVNVTYNYSRSFAILYIDSNDASLPGGEDGWTQVASVTSSNKLKVFARKLPSFYPTTDTDNTLVSFGTPGSITAMQYLVKPSI